MSNIGFKPGNILIPKGIDLNKWCVVACDQYTSDKEYWDDVKNYIGEKKSALNIIFPEVFLEDKDNEQRILSINKCMEQYLRSGDFYELKNKYIYIERTQKNTRIRKGLMGVIDLEQYDFNSGSQSLIRATEGTVLDRIPPRVQVRENAPIETPHIMLLIDDIQNSVIGPLFANKDKLERVYAAKLMKEGGTVEGYAVDQKGADTINKALLNLADKEGFNKKYNVKDKGVLLFAVGDGNHSLAAAKQVYENFKKGKNITSQDAAQRYALVEIVNLHDDALEFEPIHRVVFNVNTDDLIKKLKEFYEISGKEDASQSFEVITKEKRSTIYIKNPPSNLAVGTLQKFLDYYTAKNSGRIDYIHGADVTIELGKQEGNIGFLLPVMKKEELFKTVIVDGALPRKTFSMGHAWDKRYYLECRKIK